MAKINAKRLHTSPAQGKSMDFLPSDVNLKDNTPAFKLEKFIIDKCGSIYIKNVLSRKPITGGM